MFELGLGLAMLSTVSALVLMRWGVWRCLRWCDLDVALDRVHAELLARFEPARGGLLRYVTGGSWVGGSRDGWSSGRAAGGQATRASAYNQCHMHVN